MYHAKLTGHSGQSTVFSGLTLMLYVIYSVIYLIFGCHSLPAP